MAKAVTSTIPIVFTTGGDPVQLGLVTSLGRPGGNVTGVTQMTGEVAPKRVELAHELVPQATVFGMLINPTNPLSENVKRDSQAAALKLGVQLNVLHASTDAELDKAFTAFREMHALESFCDRHSDSGHQRGSLLRARPPARFANPRSGPSSLQPHWPSVTRSR